MNIDLNMLKDTNKLFLDTIVNTLNEIKNNPNYKNLDSAERGTFAVKEIFKRAAKSLNCTPDKAKQIYIFIRIFNDYQMLKKEMNK